MKQPFSGLYATYYDSLFPPDAEELAFYKNFLCSQEEPALEVACGAGTLLTAYAREGFKVHGLDCSKEMLDQVTVKAQKAGLHIPLYHQALEELDLPLQFQTIYIPSCAFMFITDPVQAAQTLRRLHEHLVPGGQLILSSFLPYQEMMSGQFERHCVRDVGVDAVTHITMYQTVEYDFVKQLRTCVLEFELWHIGMLQTQEQHTFIYRWYGVEELSAMMRTAGFSEITLYGDYQLKPVDAHIETFIMYAKKGPSICTGASL